ncbi:P-loop containing nucleoside triphosphate hydrolase protein [Lactarius akahatsu]|uniref:P-loop containing nucleoside triphosphate hydrolase protein n=1 Tax=Lactarius akahatsu TaxID=416441 RepID=A0AAD4LBD9_9AGAM|nr:P-loop containing nucleoside triphosphate hydrolase protein [Lactarius akahatsu]
MASSLNSAVDLPSLNDMRETVRDHFGFSPCTWQLKATLTQLEGNDLLTLAPTGSGKTLSFWIPLLFNGDGVSIVITPLNVLGEKNVDELSLVSILAVNLTTSSASDRTFKEIESLKYRSKRFINKLRSVIFDEAHCISQWSGNFRPKYTDVGRLRWLLPGRIIFYAASAMMPRHVLNHVKSILQMRPDRTREIQLCNDRPNIHLLTLEMLNPAHSYHNILCVLRFDGNPLPPPFMVFCNDQKETERLCQFARSQTPSGLIRKLLWFHSGMSCNATTGVSPTWTAKGCSRLSKIFLMVT